MASSDDPAALTHGNAGRAIAQHIGECKRMYENHAFGDGKLSWNHFSPDLTATRTRAIQFLRETPERLRTSIVALVKTPS